MILWVAASHALTLAEAVQRAGEIDPAALSATWVAEQDRLSAAEGWARLGVTPELKVSRTLSSGAVAGKSEVRVDVGALDASAWFDAARLGSDAAVDRYAAAATRLDAQYAAAQLFLAARAAEDALEQRKSEEAAARGVADVVSKRVAAGVDSALVGRSAEAAALVAKSRRIRAEAEVASARRRLSRALETEDLGALTAPDPLTLPEAGTSESPWLAAEKARGQSAKLDHARAIAAWLPVGGLRLSTPLDLPGLSVTASLTWSLDGVVNPFLEERRTALAVRIADTQYAALKADLARDVDVAVTQARAADEALAADRSRAALAAEALAAGEQALSAGVVSTIELLRLQDDLSAAQVAMVASDLEACTATLDARHAAGLPVLP